VCLRTSLDMMGKKNLSPVGNRTSNFQRITRLYTDGAVVEVFSVVTPRSVAVRHRCFRGLWKIFILKMEAAKFSEMFVCYHHINTSQQRFGGT
jgi:hypothetical protein